MWKGWPCRSTQPVPPWPGPTTRLPEGVRPEPHPGGEPHRAAPGDEADRAPVRPEELAHTVRHSREHGPEVERGGQGLRDGGERLGRLLAPADLAEESGVLQREGRVGGQGLQELPVLGGQAKVDRVVDREHTEHAVGRQQRHRGDRAEAQGLDPGARLRRELDLGIEQDVRGLHRSPIPRRPSDHALAERDVVEPLAEAEAPGVVQAIPVEPEHPERFRPQDLAGLLGDEVEDPVGVPRRRQQLAHLGGGLHPLRARRRQAQQARVLQGDRRLDGEIGQDREIGLRERARGHVPGDDDHAPERTAGHERLGHDGAVNVAEPRQRQRRAREVVDDHPLAASRRHADDALAHRDGHAPHPFRPVEGRVRAQDLSRLVQQIDASGVGVEQLGGAAADHRHQGVQVALTGDLPFDLAERFQPPQAARGDLEERRAFDGDRRMRAERAEEVHLERREPMRLPREEAERAEHPVAAGEPDAGQRADALVSRPGPIEDPLVVGEGRDDHRVHAAHDRPEEAFTHGHGPAQLGAGVVRARADLGGEPELALVLAGEPDVDQRAGDERGRGARHALEHLGEVRPRAGRFRQLDEGPLGQRRADRRARLLAGHARTHGHIPRYACRTWSERRSSSREPTSVTAPFSTT